MAAKMLQYDYKIQLEKGSRMTMVDRLSRLTKFADEPKLQEEFQEIQVVREVTSPKLSALAKEDSDYQRMVADAGKNRLQLPKDHPGRQFRDWNNFHSDGEFLYSSDDRLVIPRTGIRFIMDLLHESHAGFKTTWRKVRQLYVWKNARADVARAVHGCNECLIGQQTVSKKKLTERIPIKELEKEMEMMNQQRIQVNKLQNRKWYDRKSFKVGDPVIFKRYQVQGDKMQQFQNRGVISEVMEDGRAYEIATETLLFYRNKAHIVKDYSRIF